YRRGRASRDAAEIARCVSVFPELDVRRIAGQIRRQRAVSNPHGAGGSAMSLTTRDRRALILLGAGALLIIVLRFGIYGERDTKVVAAHDSIPLAEKRLARLRQVAATAP